MARSAIRQPGDLIQVTAPCDMQGGYTFLANTDTGEVPVTVPRGGVSQGQTLYAVHRAASPSSIMATPVSWTKLASSSAVTEWTPLCSDDAKPIGRTPPTIRDPASFGQFKDGLFDCCTDGPWNRLFCSAVFCPQILAAQVWVRLGQRNNTMTTNQSNAILGASTLLCTLFWSLTVYDMLYYNIVTGSASLRLFYSFYVWSFSFFTLILLTLLRTAVRRQYEIEGSPNVRYCLGSDRHAVVEDAFVALFCGCCSVAQAARHTQDIENEEILSFATPRRNSLLARTVNLFSRQDTMSSDSGDPEYEHVPAMTLIV